HAKAEHNLGTMYMQGLGVEKDAAAALTWFKKAAEEALVPSQDTLGQMCLSGTGTKKDCREAARWFQKAAEQDYVEAELHLGRLFFLGEDGCERNYAKSAKWLEKAAAAGKPWAQNTLGFLFERGFGVKQDEKQAERWFRTAADQGDAKAQANMERLYASRHDLVQAYVW